MLFLLLIRSLLTTYLPTIRNTPKYVLHVFNNFSDFGNQKTGPNKIKIENNIDNNNKWGIQFLSLRNRIGKILHQSKLTIIELFVEIVIP